MDALILAGGENKRLSSIKGFIEINGRKIIESTLELLNKIFERVIISTNTPELYFYLGVPMVGDIMKYKGPMTGILSALLSLKAPEIFVTACDMPFINPELVRYIVDRWEEVASDTLHPSGKKNWDGIIPLFDKRPQPLLGIYSKEITFRMEESIKNGQVGLRKFLQKINIFYIKEEEVRAIDPKGKSFVNINTPEDFKKEIGGEICLV
ncbi:MAG: molybdenum cofactor guanylyltransferase [Nitrospirota bacterium]|nr:molybdenum cofactor guanylyltransferase [Nitrospirota bacterium]